jgi:hypothetical protein
LIKANLQIVQFSPDFDRLSAVRVWQPAGKPCLCTWTYLWIYGNMGDMKTTLEIPDDLMQRVKLRAVHRRQKLKDVITQLLELGMSAAPAVDKPQRPPRPVRLKGRGLLGIDDIEAAISAGRD